MTTITENIRFRARGGTASALAALNEAPLARELIFEINTGKIKFGDGVTLYNSLPYFGGAGAATSFALVEVNLGSVPRLNGRFTIAGTGLTIGKPVQIFQAPGPYTGKGTRADEAEMDLVTVSASVTSSTVITAYWASPRRVRGNIKFNYLIGA